MVHSHLRFIRCELLLCTIYVIMANIVVYGCIYTCDSLNYCVNPKIQEPILV